MTALRNKLVVLTSPEQNTYEIADLVMRYVI